MFSLCSPKKKKLSLFRPSGRVRFRPPAPFKGVGERERLCVLVHAKQTKKTRLSTPYPHFMPINHIPSVPKKNMPKKKISEDKKEFVPCVLGNSKCTFVFPVPLQTVAFETKKPTHQTTAAWSGTSRSVRSGRRFGSRRLEMLARVLSSTPGASARGWAAWVEGSLIDGLAR